MASTSSDSIPLWLTRALKGLVYWIGYKRTIYSKTKHVELALASELRTLICALLDDNLSLKPEHRYAAIVNDSSVSLPSAISGSKKVDFAVRNVTSENGKLRRTTVFAIELKRSSATKQKISQDFLRLALLKTLKPTVRAFLVIVGEVSTRRDYVRNKSSLDPIKVKISKTKCHYKVLETIAPGASLGDSSKRNYASIIEVCMNDG
jgi:hypothetical protein